MGELARVAIDVVLSSLAMAELATDLQLAIASSSLFWLLRGLPNLTSLAAIVIPSVGGWLGRAALPWAEDDFYFFASSEWGLNPLFPHSNPNLITLPTGPRGPTQYFAKLVYFPI